MKKLLVPVDFSEQSINAFRFALDVASKCSGSVLLLHVIALPVLHDSVIVPIEGLRQPLIDELKEVVRQRFSRIIEMYNSHQVGVSTEVVVSNRIHDTIIDQVEKEKADLVVMGTKRASGIWGWMVGSNTENIVRTAPVPVLAIKQYVPGKRIRNIIFPNALDLKNQEELVIKVKALQDLFNARLHIIWVNTPALYQPDSDIRRQLAAFAEKFMLKDFTINVFNYNNEEAGILEFTRQINGDLIAMGTHGLTGFAHLFCGSIAENVATHVDWPVWTYHPKPEISVTSEQ